MFLKNKRLRYYYWLTLEFTKKHSKMILLSFFLSFFLLLSLISFSPYLNRFLVGKRIVVGMVGNYDYSNLPEEVLNNVSHGLVFVTQKGQITPALASSWEILNGGKDFKFHLKKDLFWDDGKELTANDINYNFRDVQVKAQDKNTITFHLNKPLPIFPTYLVRPIIRYPLHGTVGLYKVDRVRLQQGLIKEITLSPNKTDLPFLTYKFYPDESKLINAYKIGDINKMTLLKKSLADTFIGWKNTKISRAVDYSKVLTLFFNLKNSLFNDKGVREAVALSIPKEKFADQGELATGPIPPTSWAYNPDLKQTFSDLSSATKNMKKYLTASESANLNFDTYYDYLEAGTIINDNLKTIGLNPNLTLSQTDRPDFDILLAFWKIPQDPDQYFFWHSTQNEGNITGYKNVKVDKQLEDGRSTLDVTQRGKHYSQFQRVLVDDLPAIFIYYPYVYTIERK